MPYTAIFSPLGDKIAFGCDFPNICNVYKVQNNKMVLYNSYKEHHQTVIANVFIDNETVATGGGEDNEIDIWKLSDTGPKRLKRFIGKGRSVYNASLCWHSAIPNLLIHILPKERCR
jgi:WD40 repeat protein